ncbi:ferric-chelate reductase [Apiospora aurea]|uniref:Ferric-chelate reductase n=1 Tax=Apiospora aurea TaxID=335848 RepID=A0ABR1QQ21_9PEZI
MPLPWLDQPIMLESSRMDMCELTPEQCTWSRSRFRNWYIADLVYGLGALYFFIGVIAACMISFWASRLVVGSSSKRSSWRKLLGAFRYLAYRRYNVAGYLTPSVGVVLLLASGALFFLAMTLGPGPYYWPDIMYGSSPPIATRAGWMALACLPFILILSTKANMIATLTGVSHEKLIIFHNWTGWAMFVLSLVHTFPFIVVHIQQGDMVMQWNMSIFYWSGVVALVAQAYLQFMSLSFIRNRFYEFFKATHMLAALIFVLFLFFHCDYTLTSWHYFIAAGVLYTLSFLYSQIRTYSEFGFGLRATLDMVSDTTMRITVPARTTWQPTQHMFLRFVALQAHALTSHPFTICSVPAATSPLTDEKSNLVFYVQARQGVTGRLATMAAARGGCTVPVLIDGPYGGIKGKPLSSYDDNLVVACGAGAPFSLGLVMDALLLRRAFAAKAEAGVVTLPRVEVLIATRDPQFVQWYCEALTDFMVFNGLPIDLQGIRISVFQTGGSSTSRNPTALFTTSTAPDNDAENREKSAVSDTKVSSSSNHSANSSNKSLQLEIRSGRPDIGATVRQATRRPNVSLALVACGPGGVVEEVQAAAAEAQLRILGSGNEGAREVYLHTEHFS